MIVSYVGKRTRAKQEGWKCTQIHHYRRKEIGLELEKKSGMSQ